MLSATLAMFATLSLATTQAGPLELANARITYGELGDERPDNELLPGGVCFLSYEIKNLTVGDGGEINYMMGMTVLGPKGEKSLEQKPTETKDFLPLGGDTMPARAFVGLKFDQEPGEYTIQINVTDKASKVTKSLEKKFVVVKPKFGIVGLYSTRDPNGTMPAPPRGYVGDVIFFHFNVVHFNRARATKQPDVEFQMSILDEAGNPTTKKPNSFVVNNDVGEEEKLIRMRFTVPMSRPGKFTVVLKATDEVAGTSDTVKLPITVEKRY